MIVKNGPYQTSTPAFELRRDFTKAATGELLQPNLIPDVSSKLRFNRCTL